MLSIPSNQRKTLDELNRIPITERGERSDRWQGVQHGELVSRIFNQANYLGLNVKSHDFGVSEDSADLFGDITFAPSKFLGDAPNGTALELGIRHSNASRFSITFVTGLRVFICSNGIVIGEYVLRRKHTCGIELDDEIRKGLLNFMHQTKSAYSFVEGLKNTQATENRVNRLLTNIGREQILPWSHIGYVDAEYRNPSHDEFKPRTMFSLYNAFTEIAKRRNPTEQHKTIGLLKPHFDKELNIAVAS